jgi:hypothetical protein
MKGLDYGSGMAYNFFYGYLRLVLPESGAVAAKGMLFPATTINEQLFIITCWKSFVTARLEN